MKKKEMTIEEKLKRVANCVDCGQPFWKRSNFQVRCAVCQKERVKVSKREYTRHFREDRDMLMKMRDERSARLRERNAYLAERDAKALKVAEVRTRNADGTTTTTRGRMPCGNVHPANSTAYSPRIV